MQTMGERIKRLRNDVGITQEDLAKISGLKDRSSIANWEADRVTPDYSQLQKVASYFNVSIDYLINGNKDVSVTIFTEADVSLVNRFNSLSLLGQTMIMDMLNSIEKMEKRKQ